MIPHSKPWIGAAERAAVDACLRGGQIARGATTRAFEEAVAARLGLEAAHATSSGTQALALALTALGIGRDDEVLIPAYVCDAVTRAVTLTGATTTLCDVGPGWVATPERVAEALTPQCRAIVLPEVYGRPTERAAIAALGVPVVLDLAQAFPDGPLTRPPGVEAVVCSFHATKCLSAAEGGMVLGSTTLIESARAHAAFGGPLSDLQASVGLVQLERYGEMLARRWVIAARYDAITGRRGVEGIPYRYTLRDPRGFEAAAADCAALEVTARRGVDHLQAWDPARFPMATRLYEETVSIPLYPALTEDEVRRVERALRSLI